MLRFVGLAEPCSFDEAVKIPAQWQRFMEFYGAIEHKRAKTPVGVAEPADDDGRFTCVHSFSPWARRAGDSLPLFNSERTESR
jgi:hypothetical protein